MNIKCHINLIWHFCLEDIMDLDKIEDKVLKYIVLGILLFLSLMYSGFTLSLLWNNIITPMFGIRLIGVWQAVGLSLILSFCRHSIFYPIKLKHVTANFKELFHVYFMTTSIYLSIGLFVLIFI